MDGKALDPKQGPLKLIVPEDICPERWVRMVTKISIRSGAVSAEPSLDRAGRAGVFAVLHLHVVIRDGDQELSRR